MTLDELYTKIEKKEVHENVLDDILDKWYEHEHEAHYMLSEGGWESCILALNSAGVRELPPKAAELITLYEKYYDNDYDKIREFLKL